MRLSDLLRVPSLPTQRKAIADLVADLETLKAQHNALLAKLDADTGITDTDYAATVPVGDLLTTE